MLEEILRRLDALDARLDALSETVSRDGTAALAVATDTFDDVAARLQARGIDIDERLAETLRLLEAFTAPEATAALGRIAGRLGALDQMTALLSELPPGIVLLADVFDEMARRAAARGDDFDARLRALASALEMLTRPGIVEATLRLADHLPRLADLVEESPGIFALTVDVFDAAANSLRRRGVDPETLAGRLAALGGALVESLARPAPPTGLWGALREARQPRIRRALGLAVGLAERVGRILETEQPDGATPRRLESGRNEIP